MDKENRGFCNFSKVRKITFIMKDMSKYSENTELENVLDSNLGYLSFLTLHDDDLHTFEYVIESLIEVCNHDMEQAEQCTYLVHYKGKCEVKKVCQKVSSKT